MKQFEQSHPWISFKLDLLHAPYRFWMSLGEAQSKCRHLLGAPLLPDVSREMHMISLARGVMATTAIEGNTLTEEQIRQQIEGTLTLPKSKEYLGREVGNILEACQMIADGLFTHGPAALCADDILNFNRQVLEGLDVEPHVVPGAITTTTVGVGRYRGAPREECRYLLERLCTWLNEEIVSPTPEYAMAFGILRGVLAHLYVAWIHPFGDGNGRTARLVEFHILLAAGVPSVAAHLLTNHYNETRAEYYRQLQVASDNGGNVLPFLEYALQGFIDGLKGHIEQIQDQQLRVLWDRHVFDHFRDGKSKFEARRRELMFAISSRFFRTGKPIKFAEMRTLTTKVALAYNDVTDRAIRRDLEMLIESELLSEEVSGWYEPRLERMHAQLPAAIRETSAPPRAA